VAAAILTVGASSLVSVEFIDSQSAVCISYKPSILVFRPLYSKTQESSFLESCSDLSHWQHLSKLFHDDHSGRTNSLRHPLLLNPFHIFPFHLAVPLSSCLLHSRSLPLPLLGLPNWWLPGSKTLILILHLPLIVTVRSKRKICRRF
jgi:hypothetical protein